MDVSVANVTAGSTVAINLTGGSAEAGESDRPNENATGDETAANAGDSPRKNIIPDGIDLTVTRDGDYSLSVESRELTVLTAAAVNLTAGESPTNETDETPSDTGADAEDGTPTASDLSVERLSDDGQRFVRETEQRPLGYIIVEHGFSDDDLDGVKHHFRVRKSYLNATGASVESVRLYRDEPDGFRQLETRLVGEDNTFYRFEADSPGLSLFAIGSEAPTFEVSERTLLTADPETGTVETTLTVRNIGSLSGEYLARLTVGSKTVTRNIMIAAGETVTVRLRTAVEPSRQARNVGVAGDSVGVLRATALSTATPTPTPTPAVDDAGEAAVEVTVADPSRIDWQDVAPVAVVLLSGAALLLFVLWRRREDEGDG
jgi:hypothetical protein